jgi:hypothetical protein
MAGWYKYMNAVSIGKGFDKLSCQRPNLADEG